MERKEIEIKLNKILETLSDEIGYEKTSITDKANLRTDLGLDSLDEVELLTKIEDYFEIHIPDDILTSGLGTVSNLCDIIEKLKNE